MNRRDFLAASGLAVSAALAGCSSNSDPPPRKSNVIDRIRTSDGQLRIDVADDAWVMSRYDAPNDRLRPPDDAGALAGAGSLVDAAPGFLAGLSPVGLASAKGKGGGGGRGATGRATGGYGSAPRTSRGRAWWHGGAYADDWYDDHDDEVTRYSVGVAALAVAYLGSEARFRSNRPGAGADSVDWDQTFRNPDDVETYDIGQSGWYRVGAHVVGESSNHDFRWECVDLGVEPTGSGYAVDEEWKVSPRI